MGARVRPFETKDSGNERVWNWGLGGIGDRSLGGGQRTDSEGSKSRLVLDHFGPVVPAFGNEGQGVFEGALDYEHEISLVMFQTSPKPL